MDIAEIKKYICVGKSRSVCVDILNTDKFPGYVRTVTIYSDYRVNIVYNVYDMNEGGPSFWGKFESLKETVDTLEEFLGKPISDWENFSKTGRYPESPSSIDLSVSHKKMKQAILNNDILTPQKGNFQIRQDCYWSNLAACVEEKEPV